MHRITRIGTALIIGMPIVAASLPSELCMHYIAKRVLARVVTKSRRKQLLAGVDKRGLQEMRSREVTWWKLSVVRAHRIRSAWGTWRKYPPLLLDQCRYKGIPRQSPS